MKNNRLRYAAPGAALTLALLLSSCATPGPAGEPSSGSAATQRVAEKPGLTFSTPVTSDLEQFVKAGQTWAVQTQGEVLFAGNKAVSVYQVDPSSEIQVTVFNLDDGSTVGIANLEPLAKAEQLEDSNPVGQVMIRHDGTDFLAVTQNGFLSSTTARGVEDETDAKVSFIELGNPANVIDFEQRNRSASSPDITASVGSARQLVTLSGYLASEDKVQTFYATPDGVFEAKAAAEEINSPLGVVALSQGEPVVQGEVGVMAFELKVSDGWDVVRSIDKLEKYPVGLMEVLALEDNLISFYYGFNEEEPHYGSYLVDLDTRKITQTSREGKESEGFSVKDVRHSVDGEYLLMKDSAYNKAAGTVVDFKGDKGAEGLALGVANEDGTRAYGTVGTDHAKVLVDLTSKKIQAVEPSGEEGGKLPRWITPENTVVFSEGGILSGVRTE